MESTVYVPKKEFAEIKKMLRRKTAVPDAGELETLWTNTAKFEGGIEVDINFNNSLSGPYLDFVLYDKGCEMVVGEPTYSIDGTTTLEYGDTEYSVTLKRASYSPRGD